jgi:hypothetical protein
MNKDKFLKKLKIGQKVFTAYSKSNEIIDQEINHFEETENQIYFKINKEKYRFSKSLFNISRDKFIQAKWFLEDAKKDYKNAKNNLTNKN